MEIIKKMVAKSKNLRDGDIPTIAFIGDSVTQGCFEIYMKAENAIETVFDKNYAYHNYIAKIFAEIFPDVPVTIINAGISGDNAVHALTRLEKDVISKKPDLTVVSFGLNDSSGGIEKLPAYKDALRQIFTNLKEAGSEVIFLTENMMNTKVSCHIKEPFIKKVAEMLMDIQNNGTLDAFFDAAREVAAECDVKVCDVYAKWKKMAEYGIDTTALLSNDVNHPTRGMNWLFAHSLVETMMQD